MNARQAKFVQEYLLDLNATQAAIRADLELTEWRRGLDFYVYALIDPRDDQIFYIGKGSGSRCFQHVREWQTGAFTNARKALRIGSIIHAGRNVRAAILDHGLAEHAAFRLESAFIASIGRDHLTNNSSPTETVLARIRHLLATVVPFDRWFLAKDRTDKEVALYWETLDDLRAITKEITP